ncbi:MAG: hypothetical protein HC827_19515 [Cyanobacteria bacterium RM1_2_2]|nr:hypothetical protein [Cyanobacteria bacterium RM1_2_2]
MDRRPESNRNGRPDNGKPETNGKATHPMIELRRSTPPPVYSRRVPSLLPWILLCLAAALWIGLFLQDAQPPSTPPIPEAEAFRWAVNRAMSAAELTQTAQSPAEWQQVTSWWEDAIELMQAVPNSDARYRVAVEKITEYQNNLNYAQSQLETATNQPTVGENIWGVGSRRAAVIKSQGEPTDIDRYDSLCKEVLHYGKSKVELDNGVVARYEDFDRNLKGSPTPVPPSTVGRSTWDLGSTKATVFSIQGTPTRVINYDYSERETLYYGESTVELTKDLVTGYNNISSNLRVYIAPILLDSDQQSNTWTLDSSREQLLRVQGTPAQITSDSASCGEMFRYGGSTVNLKNGFVSGYDNFDKNLRVKAK